MLIQSIRDRLRNKVQWIRTHHWPRFVGRVQFLGLLFGYAKSMEISDKAALIVSPHQDDETLGCGGVIALKRERGIEVNVAFITDGAASHVWHPQYAQGEIAPIRQQEAVEALGILGVEAENIHCLGYPDGQLRWIEADRQQRIVDQLVALIQRTRPEEIYVTHQRDRSSDHEVAYELVARAILAAGGEIKLIQYPIWILWKPVLGKDLNLQELAGLRRLRIGGVVAKKNEALRAYRSQYQPIAETTSTVLPSGFLWRFELPYELFVMAAE
jgi:N-acetylglucosamine malate deacetylase 1